MAVFQDLVAGLRRFRSEHQISPKVRMDVVLHDPRGMAEPWWDGQLAALAGVHAEFGDTAPAATSSRVVAGPIQAFIALSGLVDVGAERSRIEKAIVAAEESLQRSTKKLDNAEFRERAPAAVVAKEEAKAEESRAMLEKLRTQLGELG